MSEIDPKADGIEELQRQQSAQEFELPDRAAPSPNFFGASDPFGAPSAKVARPERAGEPKTLEDLYVIYPELGKGDWKIRVSRTSPRSFRGRSTAGFLGDFYERMSLEEFGDTFGGGRYNISVLKPVSTGDTIARSDYKQVKEIRIAVPGDPSLSGIPSVNNEGEGMSAVDARTLLGHPSDAVEIERIHASQKDKDRDRQDRVALADQLNRERERARQGPVHHVEAVYETSKRAFDDYKENNAAQQTFWQQEVDRLRAELNVRDVELKDVRASLLRAETDAANTSRSIETVALRDMRENTDARHAELKERTEDDRRRMLEDHARKLDSAIHEHRRQIDEISSRHSEERRNYEAAQALERERAREEIRARVENSDRSKESELRSLKEGYEGRLDDIRRSAEREIDSVREQTRREVESTRQTEHANATLVRETANTKLAVFEGEMTRVRGDCDRLTSENVRLRDEQHKPPMEALIEAKEMASLVGMVESSEIPTTTGEPTWGQQALSIGEKLAKSVPELFKDVVKMRDDNRRQSAAAADQAQRGRQMPVQQMAVQQMQPPAGRYAPPTPQIVAPSAQSTYSPPPLGTAMYGAGNPVPLSPVVSSVPSPLQPGGEVDQSGSNPMGQTEDSSASAPQEAVEHVPMVMQDQPPAQQQQQQPAQQQQESVSLGSLPPQAVGQFFTELETAVTERVIPVDLFAKGFINSVGVQAAAALHQQVVPEQIVETAKRATGGQSRIVTREGQRYVRDMWSHVGVELAKLQQSEPQAQSQPEPQPPATDAMG